MRALRWRSREQGWRISYWLLVFGLQALALLRNLALGVAVLLHRAHLALAERGGVLVDTLGSTVDEADGSAPGGERYAHMARALLPPASRPAEEVRR